MAGYSFGTMLSFERAKVLLANGDEVAFHGSFNLPPHIKDRMRQLDWAACILHLAYFLDLMGPDIDEIALRLAQSSREETISEIAQLVDQNRMAELSLTRDALGNWDDLSHDLQIMARDYEPSGSVRVMDVFVAEPLAIVAANKEEWKRNRLSNWANFCDSEQIFPDVDGEHYTMIGEKHVLSFQKIPRKALQHRGL
ncbi:hypothetical protein VTL71DRAFT_3699 [Oculimacula yallundae]|uniref:Uncharacterized protein n=1 Tax=Oculimacula yallundae TaxID=86028 RepID=A0ABR4C4X3_9HELO